MNIIFTTGYYYFDKLERYNSHHAPTSAVFDQESLAVAKNKETLNKSFLDFSKNLTAQIPISFHESISESKTSKKRS